MVNVFFSYLYAKYSAHGYTIFPPIWNRDFLKIHNCVICSSVILSKSIIDKIGLMRTVKNGQEDYDYWLRALEHTNSAYVSDGCFYYDNGHGSG